MSGLWPPRSEGHGEALHPAGPEHVLALLSLPISIKSCSQPCLTPVLPACPGAGGGDGGCSGWCPGLLSDAAPSWPLAQAGGWATMTLGQAVLGTRTQSLNMAKCLAHKHTRTTLRTRCSAGANPSKLARCLFTCPCHERLAMHLAGAHSYLVHAPGFRHSSPPLGYGDGSPAGSTPSVGHTLTHAGYRTLSIHQPRRHTLCTPPMPAHASYTCQPVWLHAESSAHAKPVGHMLYAQQWQATC